MKAFRFILSISCIAPTQFSFAQTGQWKLTGNSLSGSEKLGSTNSFPLNFITGNTQRMSISTSGKVGIGTTSPEAKLHIVSGSAGSVTANVNSTLVTESAGDNYTSLLAPASKESGILFGNPSLAEDGRIVFNGVATPEGFQFNTGNQIRMVVAKNGSVGIGTVTPRADLHIVRRGSGVFLPNANSPLVVENSAESFINVLAPSSRTTGILFGSEINAQDGGVIYNGSGTARGMQFNVNGNLTKMVLTDNGAFGLGTKNPQAEMHIVTGNAEDSRHGFRIQNNGSGGVNWTLYAANNDVTLDLFSRNSLVGFFNPVSGTYISLSDARKKKDVEDANDVLKKIMQLNVKKYHFLQGRPNEKKSYGMMAQEVEKEFPEIVYHKMMDSSKQDLYALDYSALGVLAIKATIEKQQVAIENLQSGLEEIKAVINRLSKPAPFTTRLSSAHLNQNAPNPFKLNTMISYYIPEIKGAASIEIISSNGQVMKIYPVTQKGNGRLLIEAGTIAAGTYYCVLKIDGIKMDTKQIMIIK